MSVLGPGTLYEFGAAIRRPVGRIHWAGTETATRWAARNGCHPTPTITQLPDASPPDGTHVELRVWSGGDLGTEVASFVVHGGAHTWPGGAQYARSARIGLVSRAVDASALIWHFFADHPRTPGGR